MKEILSEQDWLNFVENQLKTPSADIQNIRFVGWPKLEIVIDGRRYNGTLPSELMRGFVNFQDEFYRAYVELRYKSKNLQRLTVEDRERLEFVFKIENNCTKGTADESEWLNTILDHLDKVFLDMTDEMKICGLAILVFAFTGYKVFEKFSDNGVKAKEIDAGNDALRIQKEGIVEAIAASNSVPDIAKLFQHNAENAFRSVFKGAEDAEKISIGMDSWGKQQIAEIIRKPDQNKEKKPLSMHLFIDGIKRNPGYLLLNVIDEDDNAFSIKANSDMITQDEKDLLFDAFKSERSIKIDFTAAITDGVITGGSFSNITTKTHPQPTQTTLL